MCSEFVDDDGKEYKMKGVGSIVNIRRVLVLTCAHMIRHPLWKRYGKDRFTASRIYVVHQGT